MNARCMRAALLAWLLLAPAPALADEAIGRRLAVLRSRQPSPTSTFLCIWLWAVFKCSIKDGRNFIVIHINKL